MPPSIANLLELSTTPSSPRNSPVQAYAKLEFGAYSFYVQSLSVTLGRKAAETDHVDVHLGSTKAISRQHARIQYSFARNAFEIYVGGRNGLFVDDIFYEQGSVVPLDDRTQVQIGEIKFNFLLPHQGTVPQEPLERESSEEPSSPSSSITPTPPPQQDQQDQPAERPDIPYATLIAQSLLSHPRRRRTLQEIYTWIQDHHAFFKSKNKNWQSSIRHNLLSSPAFVLYGPRPGEESSADKKSKRGKDEWGISPEYEGLIGDLSAKEGDTSKLSDKLHKKKPAPPKPKPPPPQPPPVIPPKEPTTSTSPPAPTHTEDKSKLEEIVKNLQGKGVDMGALLQEALAKMKGIPVKPPPAPPPPKRLKTFPEKTQTFPSASTTNLPLNNQLPSTMPMPLPYTATKVAPIPMVGANIVQIKKEPFVNAPVPSLSPTIPPPTSGSTTDEASPKLIESLPAVSTQPTPQSNCANVETKLETAASKRSPRGKKRPLEP